MWETLKSNIRQITLIEFSTVAPQYHMTYIVLAIDKRLNDYETMGALFEEQRESLMALTLWQRLLAIIKRLLEVLADMLGISYEELSASIVRDEEMLSRYIVLAEALEDYDKAA